MKWAVRIVCSDTFFIILVMMTWDSRVGGIGGGFVEKTD